MLGTPQEFGVVGRSALPLEHFERQQNVLWGPGPEVQNMALGLGLGLGRGLGLVHRQSMEDPEHSPST